MFKSEIRDKGDYRTATRRPVRLLSQEMLDGADRLPRAVLVFDQRKADVTFSERTEADAWRNSHERLFE